MRDTINTKRGRPAHLYLTRFTRSWALRVLLLLLLFPASIRSQRTAVLAPDNSEQSKRLSEQLVTKLQSKLRVLDSDLSRSAFDAVLLTTPFNLTTEESKRLGAVMGCQYFILIRSSNQRRSAFGRPEYHESFVVIYLFSARTGRLAWWQLISREAATPTAAAKLLDAEAEPLSDDLTQAVRRSISSEMNESDPAKLEEVPPEGSPLAKGFRPPVPYRRIKPDYTSIAALYEVTATVEALVDLDAKGAVQRVEIVRWAGFGLDESVEKAIRTMNWRPAERNGKPLAMRFLLRYNFKKVDKDPPDQ